MSKKTGPSAAPWCGVMSGPGTAQSAGVPPPHVHRAGRSRTRTHPEADVEEHQQHLEAGHGRHGGELLGHGAVAGRLVTRCRPGEQTSRRLSLEPRRSLDRSLVAAGPWRTPLEPAILIGPAAVRPQRCWQALEAPVLVLGVSSLIIFWSKIN